MYINFINTDDIAMIKVLENLAVRQEFVANSVIHQSKSRRTGNVDFDLLLPFEWFMCIYISSMDFLINDN